LQGFVGTSLYFKALFDKVGVEAQFERIEEFKSAPEAWTRTGPTVPAMAASNQLYDSIYRQILSAISEGRGVSLVEAERLIDNGPYTSGDLEREPHICDAVATPEQLSEQIARELGRHYPYGSTPAQRTERWSFPQIAVIFVEGDIVDGPSRSIPLLGRHMAGGDTIAQAIAAARGNPDIEAIILRINSPGGSALASEAMSREVFKTRGVKPIICSFGDVAASGGYFAAAGCDLIFADPMTVTGSIGIFNGKFDLSGLLARIGITWKSYKRGERADLESYYRPLTEEERAFIKAKLHYYYGRFIQAVAKGRNMMIAEVDQVGRGRVWSGAQAKLKKLVDRFGGIGDALVAAKLAAGMRADDAAQLLMLPKPDESLLSRLTGGLFSRAEANETGRQGGAQESPALRDLLPGAAQKLVDGIPASLWEAPTVPQARLPFAIVWE
jgi:protease-4